ncbi:hypothetical protein ABTM29_19350, partial [Acinetobacter baumannii]
MGRRDILTLANDLLSHRGEASGVAIAEEILARYGRMTRSERRSFLVHLAEHFGADPARLDAAIENWRRVPSSANIAEIHDAAEP